MAKASDTSFQYLKSNNFLRIWSVQECTPCAVEGAQLTFARAAPRVAHARTREVPPRVEKEVPPRQRKEPVDPYLNTAKALLKAGTALQTWLSTPPPPPQPPKIPKWLMPAPPKAPPPPRPAMPPPPLIPLFDLQEIPKAMRKIGMPVAAKLQERWFAGEENYSRSNDDLMNEINQNGVPYAPAFVDQTTVAMEWVLSFPRAKLAFDDLVMNRIREPRALVSLKNILSRYKNEKDILPWVNVKSDIFDFHKKFQFQMKPVNATWGQKIEEFLRREVTARGVPDDLTGALGAFNLYAAVQYAWFEKTERGVVEAVVSNISVYVRDPYEFSTEQYLGHWNSRRVAVVPSYPAMRVLSGAKEGSLWFGRPIKDESNPTGEEFLYPITNGDYRDWRSSHKQGGDFMIYTDRMNIRLDPPIRVALL